MGGKNPGQMTVIVACVLAAAAAIASGCGGGETTVTAPSETVTTTAPEETTSGETTTGTTEPDSTSPSGQTPMTTAFSEDQLRSNQGNGSNQCISAGGGAETRSLGGETLTDATILNVIYNNRTLCDRWLVILPVEEYTSLEIGGIGWADKVPDTVSAEFSIYADSRGSEPLFTDSFEGPGDTASTSVDLAGANNLILEWKPGEPIDDFAGDFSSFRFVLDMAYVS